MNAIILAAGVGSRLKELTDVVPKCLLRIGNTILIERQIEMLNQLGIDQIFVVAGYKKELLEYLVHKYPSVTMIYNSRYKEYNNIYSLYLLKAYIGNTFILEGDIYIHDINVFNCQKKLLNNNYSIYYGIRKKSTQEEWALKIDKYNVLDDILIRKNGVNLNELSMSGISYWSFHDGAIIKKILEYYVEALNLTEIYWDKIIKDNLHDFKIKVIEIDSLYEIDTLNDFQQLLKLNNKHKIDNK